MNKVQMAQLAWSSNKNKENLDFSMQEMGKSISNLVTAMANVDAKITHEILLDIASQVEKQAKTVTETLIKEKGVFVESFLNEYSDEPRMDTEVPAESPDPALFKKH